jgi:hypothetical protein
MALQLSAAEMQSLGLDLAGFGFGRQARTCAETNIVRFHGSYGASPEAYTAVFLDLQTTQIVKARIERPDPRNFLICLNWLKTYKTESQIAGHFDCDGKTARKWIWEYATKIQMLKGQKVSL